ncbi:MAG: glycosyltransferase [Bacteroidales bacterium]|nr:glycosyltransferase [Bacteroidales bacterium]
MIKVSVITVCKNNQNSIFETMQSVKLQDYPSIEHIIIDGASTDSTIKIVQNFNPNYMISEPDNGIYDAINKGIQHSTGDIIAILHADDIFASKNVVSQMVKTITENNTDSVYADLLYVNKNDSNKIIRHWKSGLYSKQKIKYGWMPPHPTFFVKKKIYEDYGYFDTSFKIAADYDLMLRFLYKNNISTSYCEIITTKMRVGGISNRSIKNILIKIKEDLIVAKRNGLCGIVTITLKNLRKISQFM